MVNKNDIKVIRGIRNAVKARGSDWRYPNGMIDGELIEQAWANNDLVDFDPQWTNHMGDCYNLLPNGEPACIIGFIAVDQGLPTQRESNAPSDACRWQVSGSVADAMAAAQTVQDAGFTWGVAVEQFFEYLTDVGYGIPEDVKEEA